MNTISSQFLKLPDDILLEVLAHLPAYEVVLRCRLVCRKIDQLYRERHLWIKFSRRTERMLCPRLNLKSIGASEFEITICRVEMLEENWGNKDTPLNGPLFWRGDLPQGARDYDGRDCVAILGANIVVFREGVLSWVPIQNMKGPPLCSLSLPAREDQWSIARYCYLRARTLYFFNYRPRHSVKIIDIRANLPQGPDVVVEDSFPLLRRNCVFDSKSCDGFISIHYTWPKTTRLEIDLIDLEEKTLTRLSLPPFLELIDLHSYMYFPYDTFATENHVIEIGGHQWFAIFNRPIHSYDARWPNTGIGSLPVAALDPILEGSFPWPIHHTKHVIPRSATSFAVVVVRLGVIDEIHMFLFTISDTRPIFEDICSVGILRGFCNLILPIPPPTSQYALGILGIEEVAPGDDETASEGEGVHTHFAVRIDFPDSKGDSASRNRGGLSLQKMDLTPAVDEQEEYVEVRFFDCLTGRVWFNVSSPAGMSNLVVDYLSMS